MEIHNWIRDLGFSYNRTGEVLNENQKIASGYLFILNSDYKPYMTVKFKNIYPTFVSGIDFDSSNTDAETVIATATFAYTHYEIEVFTTNP